MKKTPRNFQRWWIYHFGHGVRGKQCKIFKHETCCSCHCRRKAMRSRELEKITLSSINPFLYMTAEIKTNPSTTGSERSPPIACGSHIVKRALGIIAWTKVTGPRSVCQGCTYTRLPILSAEMGAIFSTWNLDLLSLARLLEVRGSPWPTAGIN